MYGYYPLNYYLGCTPKRGHSHSWYLAIGCERDSTKKYYCVMICTGIMLMSFKANKKMMSELYYFVLSGIIHDMNFQ